MIVPNPVPPRTVDLQNPRARINLARSILNHREPSQRLIEMAMVALSGGDMDDVTRTERGGIQCWACCDVVADDAMCPICGLANGRDE